MASAILVPATVGGSTNYAMYGGGTHADYRYTERLSATVDLTVASLGGPGTVATAEVGTRYRALALDQTVRPFFDIRAGYTHLYDSYATPTDPSGPPGGPGRQIGEGSRYGRGLGGLAGAGFEYSLTGSLALTNELSAMRNRMTTYRMTGLATIPSGATSYWMTSFRYTLGLKYNPVSVLHQAQKPTS